MKRAILIILIILMTVTLNAKAIRIVLMGDNRPSGEASQPYIFHKMLKKMAALKPDAIISTGDIISGYTDDAEKIKSMFDEFDDTIKIVGDIPFYVVPGNHDMVYAREPRKEYIRRYGKTYYSFNMENCHFIMLSSEEPGERGRIAGEQLKWLKADLKKYKDKKMHRFVCVHQPFYPRIAHVGNSLDQFPGQRDKIVSLLKKNNIEMTICGHIHIYNYCVVDGFHQIITGGAGAPPYASTYEKGGFYHFVYMIVDGDYVDYRLVIMENEMDIAAKFRRQKKFAEAEKIIQKAFTLVPNHPEPHIAATLLHHYRGDEEKFNQQFQQLLVFKNNDKEKALLDLAITLYYSD
ncbi:MAG: hypothetical protein GY757_03860, partial [bacterium]|nr:hypothetical protein [bacterium]